MLTAYYMTRQVVMVFFGEAKWESHAAEHGAHGEFKPHESSPVMLFPLVALAGLAIVGGIIQLPAFAWIPDDLTHRLEHWLHPVVEFGEAEITGGNAYDNKGLLALVAIAAALIGIAAGIAVYAKRRAKAIEPQLVADGWRYDAAVSAFMGGPGRKAFDATAWFDRSVVDGAVDGSARAVRGSGAPGPQGPDRQHAQLRGHPRDRRRAPARMVRARQGRPVTTGGSIMSGAASFPILTSLILVPAIGAVLVIIVSKRRPELVKLVALLSSMATAALAIWLLWAFDADAAGFQFESKHTWIEAWGISWHLGVDGISLFLVVLTGVLFPLSIVATDPHHDEKPYLAWMLLLEAGVMGSFISLDLFVFFIFFEIVLVPMYFLIGGWGYEQRVYAATKFFLFTMLGSAFMFVGIIATVFIARDNGVGRITFDLVELAEGANFAASTGRWLFFAFAVAFAVKVPIFPLHTWLPDAHTQAPTAGSVVLAGVLLKLGTYGFLRFGLYLFPEAARWSRPLFLTLGVIGITYGAIVAAMQNDLKRLVAYSSIAHLGFIVLGTFAFTSQAISGSVMQMINHGISTGALFLLVGMIYERRHTREIAKLRGIQQVAPMFAAGFMVVMLSSIGVPGLNGFVGEYLILIGSFLTRALVGRRCRDRCDPRRAVPALGVPAGVPWRARRRQQGLRRAHA